MPTTSPPPLYAMYLQATRLAHGTTVARKQWIVFPALTPEHLRALKSEYVYPTDQTMLYFWRAQASLENRPKWRWQMMTPGAIERDLPERLQLLEQEYAHLENEAHRWQVSPVITAQVTPRELLSLVTNPGTPYHVLRRFTAVARAQHHIAI